MAIAKNIITFFLALLLVNPACCCALNGCGAEEPPTHSCCSESSEDQENDSEEHQCMCSINDQFAESKKSEFSISDLTILANPPVVSIVENFILHEHFVVFHQAPELPPSPPIRIMYSVYRL